MLPTGSDPSLSASPDSSAPDLSAAPPVTDTDTGFTLTADQVESSGLSSLNLQPGDSFTVTITGTVTDNSDGITADIEGATGGEKSDAPMEDDETGIDSAPLPPPKKPNSRVVGPKEAGFED